MSNPELTRIQQFFRAGSLPDTLFNPNSTVPLDVITQTQGARTSPIIQSRTSIPDEVSYQAQQTACENVVSGDQFDHLVSLANNSDPSSNLRCGWIYNREVGIQVQQQNLYDLVL